VSVLAGSSGLSERSAADVVMRRLLRVPDVRPTRHADEAAHRLFSTSILISATRCLLGYVVFPILGPALGAAAGFTPIIGIPIGLLALVFDVKGMRRFFVAEHKWRWQISALYLAIRVLVVVLLVGDLVRLA
jgi:hypothetical protein